MAMKNIIILLTLGLAGCSAVAPTKPAAVVSKIQVQQVGVDLGGEFCKNFTLNNEQVAQFFKQAQEVTFKELHDRYDYLPCFVKGTLETHSQECEFSIRAGATAEVWCSDGRQWFYGCSSCGDLFLFE